MPPQLNDAALTQAAVVAKEIEMARKLRVRCAECGGDMSHYRTDGIDLHVVSVHRCSCCDPTSDSPDPVVVRLQAEVELLRGLLREAVEASRFDEQWSGHEIPEDWFVRVFAALEGKP